MTHCSALHIPFSVKSIGTGDYLRGIGSVPKYAAAHSTTGHQVNLNTCYVSCFNLATLAAHLQATL